MLFNSLSFLLFLPIVFTLYWWVNKRGLQLQNALLLVASYFFYACWDWRFLFLLLFSTALDYFTGIKMEEAESQRSKKIWFWLSVIINLGFLGVFKYYNFFADSLALAYFPFYSYSKLDSKIGFREIAMILMNKKSNCFTDDGFIPLDGKLSNTSKFDLPSNVKNRNKYYDEIVAICKLKKVQLISFMSSSCTYTDKNFFLKLKQNVPELHDYSNAIKADSLFATCGHMNRKGAEVFTSILLKDQYGLKVPIEE